MRLGYAFFGFLGDRKLDRDCNELSTPDGNATYSWAIVWEAMKRGHHVIPLQEDRDRWGIYEHGSDLFSAFSSQKRVAVYEHLFYGPGGLHKNDEGWRTGTGELTRLGGCFPELDVLLIEWRFPIPGRNTPDDKGKRGYQTDLERQTELLQHYVGTKTKVIIWDLDHKLDEASLYNTGFLPDAIFETSVSPKMILCDRTRVEPPFIMSDLLQHPTEEVASDSMAYVGSRYERDDVIDEWIAPIVKDLIGDVSFHGKWEPRDELESRWPGIKFNGRIGVAGFHAAYRGAACVPLLAKRSYMETGFITPRPWEAVLFGSIPVGLKGHLGIDEYVRYVAESPANLAYLANRFSDLSLKQRDEERQAAAHRLQHMDASHFIDRIEEVCNA